MQPTNNPPFYTLENQVPTESFYAMGEPCPVLPKTYSDESKPSSTTTTTARSSRKNKTSKRKQVKNACVNCQKACKKCDEGRACQRCLKLGIADTCVDSPRKERLKGVKRGPYKKRQKQQNGIKDQTENKAIQQPYESAVVWDPIQPSSSDLMMLSHDTNGYYSSPIPTQSSFLDNTSPLSLSEHYTSPLQSSSLSTSPASSTMILPQDTLQSLFTMEDMNLSVPIAYDPIYPSQQSISPSSSPVASLTWSTSSPTTTSFIPHLTQSIYQPSIIQQQPPKELYQQSNEQYPWYWDPSYDWSSTYSQPFM